MLVNILRLCSIMPVFHCAENPYQSRQWDIFCPLRSEVKRLAKYESSKEFYFPIASPGREPII